MVKTATEMAIVKTATNPTRPTDTQARRLGIGGAVGEVHPRVTWRFDGFILRFSTKTTLQPIVYDHIITYHLLRRPYSNGYDLYFKINTDKHTQTNALYAKNMYNTHCYAPTILESNRVAGSIPKI